MIRELASVWFDLDMANDSCFAISATSARNGYQGIRRNAVSGCDSRLRALRPLGPPRETGEDVGFVGVGDAGCFALPFQGQGDQTVQ